MVDTALVGQIHHRLQHAGAVIHAHDLLEPVRHGQADRAGTAAHVEQRTAAIEVHARDELAHIAGIGGHRLHALGAGVPFLRGLDLAAAGGHVLAIELPEIDIEDCHDVATCSGSLILSALALKRIRGKPRTGEADASRGRAETQLQDIIFYNAANQTANDCHHSMPVSRKKMGISIMR